MRLIYTSLLLLGLTSLAPLALENQPQASEADRKNATLAEQDRLSLLTEKFNSIAAANKQATIVLVETRTEEGKLSGFEQQYEDGYTFIHFATLSDNRVCELDRSRHPLYSIFFIELPYNDRYQIMQLTCSDGRYLRLIEVQNAADILDQVNPFGSNSGAITYEIHSSY